MNNVKWKHLTLFSLFIIILLRLNKLAVILDAKPPKMPKPGYLPGERRSELRDQVIFNPKELLPMNTPNLQVAKSLPKVTPPTLSTLEITGLTPELTHNAKIQIRVTRPDGTVRFILAAPDMNQEKIFIVPSLGGQPSRPIISRG